MEDQNQTTPPRESSNTPVVTLPKIVTTMQDQHGQLSKFRPSSDCCSNLRENFQTNENARFHLLKQQRSKQQCMNPDLSSLHKPNLEQQTWVSLSFVQCPRYSINRQGHIINHDNGKLVPESNREKKKSQDERRVKLKDAQDHQKKLRVHRLVAQAFLSPPSDPSWTQVHHSDSKRSNCQANNLFWGPRTTNNHNLRLARASASSTSSSSTTTTNTLQFPLYDRRHTQDGLLNPFAWSLELRSSRGGGCTYAPPWIPYYTAFNCPDLIKDLDIEQSPEVLLHHEHWAQDLHEWGGHDFDSDQVKRAQIEVGPVSNTLWWVPLHLYTTSTTVVNGQPYIVNVSMSGLIRDSNLRTIGSGQISLQHARHRVYRPNIRDCQQHHRRPVWVVESMVLAAWLGQHYHQYFLSSDEYASTDLSTTVLSKLKVYHVDGNIHHNHLYNLLVIPEHQINDPNFDQQQQQQKLLLSILDRIEPIWNDIEAQTPTTTPGMSPKYARNVIINNNTNNNLA